MKLFILIVVGTLAFGQGVLAPGPGMAHAIGGGSYAPTTHSMVTGDGTATSGANTTGATLLTAIVAVYGADPCAVADTPTDTIGGVASGNTWVSLGNHGSGASAVCIWYAANPAVGASHVFTCHGSFPVCLFQSWPSILTSSPQDAATIGGSNSSTPSTTAQTSTVTPGSNNEVCVVAGSDYDPTETAMSFVAPSLDFTLLDYQLSVAGVNVGGAAGYYAQTTAAALSTTYTRTGSVIEMQTGIACFKR